MHLFSNRKGQGLVFVVLLPGFGKIAEFRESTLKRQINGANWAVTLFADDYLGAAM